MTWLNVVLGVFLIAAVILGSVMLQRKLRGDETPLFSALHRTRKDGDDHNEIEAFIAAYRSGQVKSSDSLSGESDVARMVPANPPETGSATPVAAVASQSVTDVDKPGIFLRPEVKLAYLTFRSGLRNHHIFANVLLRDLGYGTAVVGKIDLLVCDSSFKYVALVDIQTNDPVEDLAKSVFLNRIGVKHLRLSSSAMPKPGELHRLIYGETAG